MKWSKYITVFVICTLLAIVVYSINMYIGVNKEIEEKRVKYESEKNRNDKVQKESDSKINILTAETFTLNEKLHKLRKGIDISGIKIKELREIIKAKPKWRIVYEDRIEYVILPSIDFELKLKEIKILNKLVNKWKLTAKEWQARYISERTTHEKAVEYIKVLVKKKKRSIWLYGVVGILGIIVLIK